VLHEAARPREAAEGVIVSDHDSWLKWIARRTVALLMLLSLGGCVASQAPLLSAQDSDEPLPAHFIMRAVECEPGEEAACAKQAEVTARDHAYHFLMQQPESGTAAPVQVVVHLRHLRDHFYVLQLACQPIGCDKPAETGLLYAILRVDSAERISVGAISVENGDGKWGTLSGSAGDMWRDLAVTDRDHLLALMMAHLDSDKSITWTSFALTVLPPAAAGAGGRRSEPGPLVPGLSPGAG
jgi:hypothetical protein